MNEKMIVAKQRANYLVENENLNMADTWTQLSKDGFSQEEIEYAVDVVFTQRRKAANRKAYIDMVLGGGLFSGGVFLSFGVKTGFVYVGLIGVGLMLFVRGVYRMVVNK